jgi:glycosyltransferase involved in cell wall biosynthesis
MREVEGYAEAVFAFGGDMSGLGRYGRHRAVRRAVIEMRRTFRELVRRQPYDVVLFHGKSVFPVIAGWSELPIVVDFCDATSMRVKMKLEHAPVAKVPLLALRYEQVQRLERRLAAQTPYRAFISRRDREAVLGPSDRSEIVPNGVDLEYWTRSEGARPSPACIVFTGVMDYGPNEDGALFLLEQIVPRVRNSVPDVEVLIVGRDPTPALLERAAGAVGVTVTGFVEDMRPYLERAAVCVAPLRVASGMQNKVLEAMAMGAPVVTTPVVGDGLRFDDGVEPPLVEAEGSEEFSARVVELLEDAEERARLAAGGRRFIEENFDWSASARKLERMCIEAIEGRAHGPASEEERMTAEHGMSPSRAAR